jgi:D-alanine transaminase
MPRIAYVSGRYLPQSAAMVSVEDRGYQFADGVYEVIAVHHGRLLDLGLHFERLTRSLSEMRIAPPVSDLVLEGILARVIRLNRLKDGFVYLQITRGVAPRDHAFPVAARPQIVVTAKRLKPADPQLWARGVKVVTIPEQRWARRDIKSVSLLPNVLGKQVAREQGAYEAWQVESDGTVTEGTSSNAWIVSLAGELVTAPAGPRILNGVTRLVTIELARRAQIRVVERHFTVEEAKAAREAFLTATTSLVLPVTKIDDRVIGDGKPGPIAERLRDLMRDHIEREAARC